MKKFLKYLWILPILVVTLIFGTLFLPSTEKDSWQEFQEYSKAYLQLIQSQGEIENFEDIRLSLTKDLTYKNGSYMISGENFAKVTGSKLNYLNSGELEISNSENTITLYNDANTLRINSVDIDVMSSPSNIKVSSSLFPIEDVATSLGYELTFSDNSLTLTRPFITKRLLVYTNSNLDSFGAVCHVKGFDDLHIYQYDSEKQAREAYEYFSSLDDVRHVEVDAIITPADFDNEDTAVTPFGLDDTFSYSSWGADAMSVDSYSEYLKTSVGVGNFPELVVAVLDTGIDSDHAWFTNRLATFEGQTIGANYSGSTNSTCVYEDIYGHGTHVAGIIADMTFSNVKILPVKVMGDNGYGYSSSIKNGIEYVSQMKSRGLNVVAINMSLGTVSAVGTPNHSDFQTLIDSAYNQGILSIVAAGNDGEDCKNNTPANVNSAITVSAAAHSGDVFFRPEWSNYGSYVDVCAPGADIRSAAVGGGARSDSGTSMAAPHVTGVIALLLTDYEKEYSNQDIEILLDNSAIDLGDTGWDKYYGEGLVNIEYANAELIDQVVFSNTTTDHTTPFELTLSTTTPNAKIYYTINNDKPNINNAIEYTGPFYITGTQKISAIAYIIENDKIVAYSKIRTIMYCFYGEDIDSAYTVDSDGTLLAYTGSLADVTIPMTVNGITVKTIGSQAFINSYIESITLPSTVTLIKSSAFENCVNLDYAYAPNVTHVESSAFYGCTSLYSVTDEYFPNLQIIDKYAFSNCTYLHEVSLSKVSFVDSCSFYMLKELPNEFITTITLPSATTIGESAFNYCSALTSINIPNARIVSSNAFQYCNLTGELYLPGLEYLGAYAFYNNANLTSVNLPKVTIIGSNCFDQGCSSIESVNIPKAQIVGRNAFYGCSNITELNVNELHEASSNAFNGLLNVSEISLPKLQYAGTYAFAGLGIMTLDLPNIIKLSAYAFTNTILLSNVYLPSSLEYIDTLAFSECSYSCMFHIYYDTVAHDFVKANSYNSTNLALTNNDFTYNTINNEIHITGYNGEYPENLVIPSYISSLPVTKICSNAFIDCANITNINISKLTTIEENAFTGCTNLTSVTLNNIETIESNAFKNCTSLNEVNISNVSVIGNGAFYNCESLLKVKLSNNITSIGEKALGYITGDKIIPTFMVLGYSDTVAETYANDLDITFLAIFNNIPSFYYQKYYNNGNYEIAIALVDSYITGSIIIPESYNGYTISKIGAIVNNQPTAAFMNCSFITGIQLPSTIKTIDANSFTNCSLLEEINLENVTSIGNSAFKNCISLKNVNLEHLTEIPANCFEGCEKIATLNIPNVVKINANAFSNCYDLHTVTSPNLQYIEKSAFSECANLQKIDTLNVVQLGTITSNTSYSGQVFSGCKKLKSAYFPNLVSIAPGNSRYFEKVVIGDKVQNIYEKPFTGNVTIYGYAGSTIISYVADSSINLKYSIIEKLSMTKDVESSSQCMRFEELNLSVETTGFEQTYQWYTTTANTATNGVAIEGATDSTLKVNTDNIGNSKYYVVVTDWTGETLTSSLSTVNVFNTGSTYVVNVASPTNGSVDYVGTNYVSSGENFAIKFLPNTGCYISSLVIDGKFLTQQEIQAIVNNNYTYIFENVSEDHTVEVEYESATFTITVVQSERGTISDARDSYAYGTSGYFYFTPEDGYYVEHVLLDGTPVKNTSNITAYLVSNITADHTISAKFSPRTDIEYIVNHYQQSVTNIGIEFYDHKFYNLESTETLLGTTNTMTEAISKTYIGFYVLPFENTNVDPNNKVIINIYYDRETYSVNLLKGQGIDNVYGGGNYLYGQTVTILADVSDGYTFAKWISDNTIFYEDSMYVCYEFQIINHDADFTATAVISDSPSDTPEDDNPTPPPSGDDNNNNTQTPTPENNTSTTTSSGGGGGGAIIAILCVLGGAVLAVIIVVIKKSSKRRF